MTELELTVNFEGAGFNRELPIGIRRDGETRPIDDKVAEVAFFVSTIQEAMLDRLAGCRGMTVAQLVRGIILDYLDGRRGKLIPSHVRID